MNLRKSLEKLKNLEKYLDVGIGSTLASVTLGDVAITAMRYETNNRTEGTLLPEYLMSQIGLGPGLALAAAIDTVIYFGIAYGAYRTMDKVLEYDKRWEDDPVPKRIHDGLNKIPFMRKLPSYLFLLTAIYLRIRAINSWL